TEDISPEKEKTEEGGTSEEENQDLAGDDELSLPRVSGNFTHEILADGTTVTTVVDASSQDAYQFLDLETGEATEDKWDLKFKRFFILTNGGVSGDGGVQVARLTDVDFDEVEEPPKEGWLIDQADSDNDRDDTADSAFSNGTDDWYDYDISNHTLTAKETVYVISSTEKNFYKFQVLDYYDEAGSPAIVKFRWARIASTDIPDQDLENIPEEGNSEEDEENQAIGAGGGSSRDDSYAVNASDGEVWTYLDAEDGVVSIADPANSTDWDVAFSRTKVKTNGGTSGDAIAAVRSAELDYDALDRSNHCGFTSDEVLVSARPGAPSATGNAVLGDWYDYAGPPTHAVSAKDQAYVIRTAEGGLAKLQVWSWDDGELEVSFEPILTDYTPTRLTVDATSTEDWTYLNLAACDVVTVDTASSSLEWDIALRRTAFATNSGVSGSGSGGAVKVDAATLSTPLDLPTGGWSIDEEITGRSTVDANPILNAWYDYAGPPTHAITPKDEIYWVKGAEGDYGLIEFQSYDSGTIELDIISLAPNLTTFGE
ncbi:MAG: hypothetical protein MK135_03210, partial [Polyangiaceae bacterium]|nr:hypothetical protein [Polyangiaceae bacterium]